MSQRPSLDAGRRRAHTTRYTEGREVDEAQHGVIAQDRCQNRAEPMPEQNDDNSSRCGSGRTLRNGERVVLAHVENHDTMDRGLVSLELTITDRQVSIAAAAMPETDTCRRTRRPGYALVYAQVVWCGIRFAQDRRWGGFREVDDVDGDFRAEGRTLPPDVAAGVLATIRVRYPTGSAIEVSWEQEGATTGARYYTAFLLPQVRLPQ